MASRLFIGALMLIGTLCLSVLDSPVIEKDSQNVTSEESVDSEQSKTDRITEFHLQSGIVHKSWILSDSGASANCGPPWFCEGLPIAFSRIGLSCLDPFLARHCKYLE